MTQSFEGSRGQRSALERLGEKIPGFRGFQDRELRRDVDRRLRESLASEVTALKGRLRDRARAYTDAGRIGALGGFDRLDRVLDGLSQSIRFSDYGASALFDAVKVGEPELERLYQFDLSLYDDLAQLDAEAGALPDPGGDDSGPALERLQQSLRQVEEKWRRRREVLDSVSGGAGAPAAG